MGDRLSERPMRRIAACWAVWRAWNSRQSRRPTPGKQPGPPRPCCLRPPRSRSPTSSPRSIPPITREELAQECRLHYGKQVLEAMINKHLIVQECQRRNITVTRGEVDAEIERWPRASACRWTSG